MGARGDEQADVVLGGLRAIGAGVGLEFLVASFECCGG